MEFNTILIAIIIIFITIIVKSSNVIKYFKDKLHMYNTVKNLPGPTCYPLIGSMFLFRGDMKDITRKFLQIYKTYDIPGRIWVGLKLFVIVDDPEHLKIIEDSNHAEDKAEMYRLVKPVLGNGLISASGSTAKIHRKILGPVFNEQVLSTYIEKIVQNSNRLVRVLENFNEQEIDVLKYIQLCNVNAVYDCFLGIDLDLLTNLDFKLIDSLSRIVETSMARAYKFWLHPDIIFYNLPVGKKYLEDISYLNNITNKVIRDYKESREKKKTIKNPLEENTGGNSTPFLETVFESFYKGGKYTEQDIMYEINTFILAGSDTSTNTTTFALLMLATYPEIQEKLYQELYNIYGSSDVEDVLIACQDIKEMKFLERFIKETLRVYSTVPFVFRRVSEDIKVNDNFTLPKDATLVFFIHGLNHSKKFWENPEEFNPDRFLSGKHHNSTCFKSFSYGRRNCIGQKLAMYMIKVIIAAVVRKFVIKIGNPKNIEDIGLVFGITTTTTETVLLRFINR